MRYSLFIDNDEIARCNHRVIYAPRADDPTMCFNGFLLKDLSCFPLQYYLIESPLKFRQAIVVDHKKGVKDIWEDVAISTCACNLHYTGVTSIRLSARRVNIGAAHVHKVQNKHGKIIPLRRIVVLSANNS